MTDALFLHNFHSQASYFYRLCPLESIQPCARIDASCMHTLKHTLASREGAYPHFYTHREGAYQASFRHAQHAAGGSRKRKPCPDEYRGAASADLVRVDKIDPAVDDCSRAFEGITVPDWH